jgi:hypothetical protein
MFLDRYFANRYFAPRYFASLGGIIATPTYSPILYRRRDFDDEWSVNDGASWVEAELHRENFQYYINADFGSGLGRVNLFRMAFRWMREN